MVAVVLVMQAGLMAQNLGTAVMNMFGRFLQREMFGIPMNAFLQYVVPVLSISAPRG